MTEHKGQVKYTQRAFQQDASEAMKGDVLRALVELVTNADDAYDGKGNGYIEIAFYKATGEFKGILYVKDKAGGLDGARMEKAFTMLGDQNKKAMADMGTRGLFGRGAKDIASLGRARFVSISQGKFSTLEINHRGEYQMDFFDSEPNKEARDETGLSELESGLTAALFIHANHRIPSAAEMVEKLQTNVQLRDLINRNEVVYFDERTGTKQRLVGLKPTGEELLNIEVNIPKYKLPVKFTLYKMPAKELGAVDSYSKHGIVISGRGATYENSFLHLGNRAEIGWFCGRIDAPEIHDLSRASDAEDGQTESNPTRVISRSREGLVREHPYWRQLCAAIEPHLKPILEAAAADEGAQRKEGDQLRNRFNALSNTLANKLQELLDASDSGEIPTETDVDNENYDLSIIPPRRICKKGELITLTVRAPMDMHLEELKVHMPAENLTIQIVDIPDPAKWIKHERLPVVSNTIRIKAETVGTSKVFATNGEVTAASEITVIDFDPPAEEVPATLTFYPDSVSVAPAKRKVLILRAPIALSGERAFITTDKSVGDVQPTALLKPSKSGLYCEARVVYSAGETEDEVQVSATVGPLKANAKVKITESGIKRNPKLDFEVSGRDNPMQRVSASIEEGRLMIRIFGKHKSVKAIFGSYGTKGFENENSPEASATIAEILAHQLASYVVEREAENHPERFTDGAMFFARQQMLVPHFAASLQAGLVGSK